MKTDFIKKFASRKFIAMCAGVATGVGVICSGDTLTGVVTVLVTVFTYICAESGIDAKAVKNAFDSATEKIEDETEREDK